MCRYIKWYMMHKRFPDELYYWWRVWDYQNAPQ